MECSRCGISDGNTKLFNVISSKGIVKLCENCSSIERLPIVKQPTEEQITEAQKPRSMRERFARPAVRQGETSLRALIDQKFKNRGSQNHPDLVDNFHWTIQRIRRERKITREQFAKSVGESDETIRLVESGFLPSNDYKIISKIENYLGVSLRKMGSSGFPDTSQARKFVLDNSLIAKEQKEIAQEKTKELKFDKESVGHLKISDLRDIKKRQDDGSKSQVESWEEEYPMDDERFLDNPENPEADEVYTEEDFEKK